jgi:hypothetical protein
MDEFLIKDILAVDGVMLVGAFSKIKVLGGGIEGEKRKMERAQGLLEEEEPANMDEPSAQGGEEQPQEQPLVRVEDPPAEEEAAPMEQADFSC